MNHLLRLIVIVLAAYLLVFAAAEKQADCAVTVAEELAFANDQGAIQKPELPPLYLLGKESASFESVTKEERLHFQQLHDTQIAPAT